MTAPSTRPVGRLARGVIAVIEAYRHMISPLRLPSCRFMPTCSQYAVDALTEFGLLRGGWLAIVRLGKCGPWHHGGWDPIPERSGAGDGSLPEGRSEATRESTTPGRSEATRELVTPGRSEATRESTPQLRSADV